MSLEIDNQASVETTNRLKRHDSLYGDAEKVSGTKYHGSESSWTRTLHLAFQSIGVVHGDIGTSPLYVYSSTIPNGIKDNDDLLGVLSLILYTLIIRPMLKYVFIVLYANDNGDDGRGMEGYKSRLESSRAAKIALFTITILGTSMVMGDGTSTPSISVLSAVSGIREKAPNLTQVHHRLLQKEWEGWMDFSWRCCLVRHRSASMVFCSRQWRSVTSGKQHT